MRLIAALSRACTAVTARRLVYPGMYRVAYTQRCTPTTIVGRLHTHHGKQAGTLLTVINHGRQAGSLLTVVNHGEQEGSLRLVVPLSTMGSRRALFASLCLSTMGEGRISSPRCASQPWEKEGLSSPRCASHPREKEEDYALIVPLALGRRRRTMRRGSFSS